MAGPLRIATWNICWFNRLFDQKGRLAVDDEWSGMHDVPRRRQVSAIARVLRAVDADIFAIIEAPDSGRRRSTVDALERFAVGCGLRARQAMIGFTSHTEQEIALLFDPARIVARHAPVGRLLTKETAATPRNPDPAPRFDGIYPLDLDGDGVIDLHRFSKPPLEAEVLIDGEHPLRVIAVHAKSKAPHGADGAQEAARISLLNRRKQLAQCAWLRARLDAHLKAGDDVITLGDFNDGPGLDKYERVFGRSGVEVVIGDTGHPDLQMITPYTKPVAPSQSRPATARFYNNRSQRYLNALIDFVMLSPGLVRRSDPAWRIWHPFDDVECFEDDKLKAALLDASDHFPVTVDMVLDETGPGKGQLE